jgi:hypothetical protein
VAVRNASKDVCMVCICVNEKGDVFKGNATEMRLQGMQLKKWLQEIHLKMGRQELDENMWL